MTNLLDDPDEELVIKVPTAGDAVLAKILSRISTPEIHSTKLKVLIYGQPGVGKTHLSASAPNPLVIDVERGARTLVGRDDVEVMEYVSIEQLEKTIDYMIEDNPAFSKYETIVIDTASDLQRQVIDGQLARKTKVTGTRQLKADWDIYGENTQRLRELFSQFRFIDKNIVLVAHATVKDDDITGLATIRPDLTPALAKTVAGYFDIIGYLRIDSKGNRVLQVQPSKLIQAKTRIKLPKEIMNPTWDLLNK